MTSQLTRTDLFRRAAAGGAVLTLPGIWAALAEAGTSKLGTSLTISNWPYYIDVDEKTKKRPSIEQFQRRYGIKVRYVEDVNSNDQFFGKIQAQLSRGQSIGRDIIVLTDNSPYPSLLIQKGWVEKLDKSQIPNIKNLQDTQRHPAWDPKREYSLPWQSGMTGIVYNAKRVKPITDVRQLLTDPKLKGKVTLLDQISDTLALVMLANGDSVEKVTDAAFDKALKMVEKAVKSGQIRQFTGNDYAGLIARGDIVAAVGWSGDTVQLQPDNPSIRFLIPTAGGMIWADQMLIPKKGDRTTASFFMNYVYDPKVAAQIEAYINYVCPVKGADKELLKTDPALAKNRLIFPTQAMMKKLHEYDPKALFNADHKKKWQKVLGA